jgi:hypothetical protein
MEIDNSKLVGFLREVDKNLARKITLVAVGGTAMTLLELKPSSIDIDFEIMPEDAGDFEKATGMFAHGIKKIDVFSRGLIFSQQLPEDHWASAIPIKIRFDKIRLKALHPLDIVVTKIGRLNDRDIQDIGACIGKFGLTKEEIENRAKEVTYIGKDENYEINLRHVLKRFFK